MLYSRPAICLSLGLISTAATAKEAHSAPSDGIVRPPDVRRGLQSWYYYSNCGASSIRNWITSEIDPLVSRNETIDPYFELFGVPPVGVDCRSSETDRCTTTVYLNVSDAVNTSDANVTITLDDFESYTFDEPCTRCDYEYPTGGIGVDECTDLPCEFANCQPDENGTTPETVTVCITRSRYDSFSSSEVRSLNQCFQQTAKKVFINEYASGVANVQRTEFVIEDSVGGNGDEDTLEVCQFVIDGTRCASCRTCNDPEQESYGYVEVDCSNVQEGLVTSCNSFADVFIGISPFDGWSLYMLELQDGYKHTDAPSQAPSLAPTKSPISGLSNGQTGPVGIHMAFSLAFTSLWVMFMF